MKLYHYSETAGVLLWTDEARIDPLESELIGEPVYTIPAFATTIAPPSEIPANYIAFFDFEATPQVWETAEIVPAEEPEAVETPTEPDVIVPTISKRQFWQQIATIGWIERADALAFMATGTLPEAFETAVATLDEDDQFSARMALMANEYDRNSSFVSVFAALLDKTDENIDAVFLGAVTK